MKVRLKPGPIVDALQFNPESPPGFCKQNKRNIGNWLLNTYADSWRPIKPGQYILIPEEGSPRTVVDASHFMRAYEQLDAKTAAKKKRAPRRRVSVAAITRPGVTPEEAAADSVQETE